MLEFSPIQSAPASPPNTVSGCSRGFDSVKVLPALKLRYSSFSVGARNAAVDRSAQPQPLMAIGQARAGAEEIAVPDEALAAAREQAEAADGDIPLTEDSALHLDAAAHAQARGNQPVRVGPFDAVRVGAAPAGPISLCDAATAPRRQRHPTGTVC